MIDLDVAEAKNSDLSRIVITGDQTPELLNAEDGWRFSRMVQARLGELEYAYLSWQKETLGKYHWSAMDGYIRHMICMPGYKKFWSENGASIYHKDFNDYINGVISVFKDDKRAIKKP